MTNDGDIFAGEIMALHLIKMAAGISSLQELVDRQDFVRRGQKDTLKSKGFTGQHLLHVTRFFPKRRDEILGKGGAEHGSLYWVFQKRVQARQVIVDFLEVRGEDGIMRCGIVLKGPLVMVRPQMRKAFQGWRYLPQDDTPVDMRAYSFDGGGVSEQMRRDLEELCLL